MSWVRHQHASGIFASLAPTRPPTNPCAGPPHPTPPDNPSEELEDAQLILQEYKRVFDTPAAGLGGATPTMELLAQVGTW